MKVKLSSSDLNSFNEAIIPSTEDLTFMLDLDIFNCTSLSVSALRSIVTPSITSSIELDVRETFTLLTSKVASRDNWLKELPSELVIGNPSFPNEMPHLLIF